MSRALIPLLGSMLAEDRDRRCPSAKVASEMIHRAGKAAAAISRPRLARRLAVWAILAVLLLSVVVAFALLRPREPRSPAESLYAQGLELRDQAETERAIDDAIRMFRRALSADPSFARAWAAVGEAYWKRYGWNRQTSSREEAIVAVENAFRLQPDLPEAHYAKAAGFFAERDIRAARTELQIAVKGRPDLDAAWALLGRANGMLGEYQEGRAALDEALRLNPNSFRHYLVLGLFLDNSGVYDEAAKAYRRATELKADSTMAWNSLGTAYLRSHDYKDAIPAFERSIEIEARGVNLSNLGTAYYFAGNYEAAAQNHRAATRIEPNGWEHWGNLGDSLRMLDRPQEARESYLEAIRLAKEKTAASPQDADVRSALGLFCARAPQPGCDALAQGDAAERMRPGDTRIIFRNAIIRCLLGKDQEALDWLEKGVKLGLSRSEIENDPDLPSLSKNPRYKRILELAS